MGAYVNPAGDKQLWLKRNGEQVTFAKANAHEDFKENLLVVLINNVAFTAAGICFDSSEKAQMLDDDGRPKEFFIVPKTKLLEVSNLEYYI